MVKKAPAARLGEAISEYLRIRTQKFKRGTVRQDMTVLGLLAKRIGGNPWMAQIGPEHLEDFFYGPGGVSERCNAATFNSYRAKVARFMKFCMGRGWIFSTMMDDIDNRRVPQKQKVYLTAADLKLILESCKRPRDRMAVAMSINTLMRASEIFGTKIRDVDLSAGFIYCNIYKSAKVDQFPISSDLDSEIRRWLVAYQAEFPDEPLNPDWYLVPSQVLCGWGPGGVRAPKMRLRPTMRATNPHLVFQRCMREAGFEVPKGQGFHTGRRSMAQLLLDKGYEEGNPDALEIVQSALHHSSRATTERYLDISRPRQRRDEMIQGKPLLSAMIDTSNVVALRPVSENG